MRTEITGSELVTLNILPSVKKVPGHQGEDRPEIRMLLIGEEERVPVKLLQSSFPKGEIAAVLLVASCRRLHKCPTRRRQTRRRKEKEAGGGKIEGGMGRGRKEEDKEKNELQIKMFHHKLLYTFHLKDVTKQQCSSFSRLYLI